MIPQNKISDPMANKPKAYQEIIHEHEGDPTLLQSKQCQRCHFDLAETSLVEKIKTLGVTSKMTLKGKDFVFSKMIVHRGRLDDCIAWDILWS